MRLSRSARALAVFVVATGLLAGCSSDDPAPDPGPAGTTTVVLSPGATLLPPGSGDPAPTAGPTAPYRSVYARNDGPLAIYDQPGASQPARTLPNPLPINDGAASVPLVLLQKRPASNDWLEVYLPIRPNGSTGYVKTADVRTEQHSFRIEVELSAFSLKAYNGDTVILDTKIATAKNNTPTPGGLYFTNQLLQDPTPNSPYGTYAYGLSGFSDTLTSFNGGNGQLGIHGTNEPDKIGQQVSSGCIRLRNADIEKLAPLLPLGVPVNIKA